VHADQPVYQNQFTATMHGQTFLFRVVIKQVNPAPVRVSIGQPASACDNPPFTVGGCNDFGPYSCGTYQTFDTSVDEYGPNIHVWLQSENTSYICNYAYNNWVSAGCAAVGATCTPAHGVLGNNTWTVNPWGNYYETFTGGTGSDTYYCRHYQTAANTVHINYWCD